MNNKKWEKLENKRKIDKKMAFEMNIIRIEREKLNIDSDSSISCNCSRGHSTSGDLSVVLRTSAVLFELEAKEHRVEDFGESLAKFDV